MGRRGCREGNTNSFVSRESQDGGQTGKASWMQHRPSLWFSTRGGFPPQETLCNTWDTSDCHSWRCYWHLESDRDAAQHLLMPRAAPNHGK